MNMGRIITFNDPVILTGKEVAYAKAAAKRRDEEAATWTSKRVDESTNDRGIHIQGALAECAAAKKLGLPWISALKSEKLNPGVSDIGAGETGLQVRSTTYRTGHLILRPRDSREDIYVLVVSLSECEHHLVGWMYGYEGMIEAFWRADFNGPPAWFIPQGSMKPVSALPWYFFR